MTLDKKPASGRREDYKLWLWVAGAFIVLIAAWATLIVISKEYQPAVIPLETH